MERLDPISRPLPPVAPDERPGRRRVAVRLLVVALLLLLDLWSKAAVFAWLEAGPEAMRYDAHGHLRYPLVDGWLTFMLSLNPGMAWGFDRLPPLLLVGGRAAAVIFLMVLVARTPANRRALVAALVLILAGAMGNLYDNLVLEPRRPGARFGEVRDFIDVYFPMWDWHFPTFNVADACISVGAVFLFASSFMAPREVRERELAAAAAGPPERAPGG